MPSHRNAASAFEPSDTTEKNDLSPWMLLLFCVSQTHTVDQIPSLQARHVFFKSHTVKEEKLYKGR